MKKFSFVFIIALMLLPGCQTAQKNILDSDGESQVKIRSMQTRYFETGDKQQTLQTIIATLQDLGFVIDKASYDLGTVSGTKLDGYRVRMTVVAIPRGEGQTTVRANAQYNIQPIKDPILYQQFFDALAKGMFLTAHIDE
ncbi:hypothetical protein GO013_16380 [Pseudodesulfovibrio sp. JC047]|uniref:hypothetical protein n=1 Tax=Pseudodesulfovibrio sp. JC047 TaxID=2683199 RepID=UPI0013D4F2ED|nr:hypothetical protein [Pseudodesulfovibrio sp. JC047]NDV20989.1 hypothetical protein [Pseudodesulfovibrio sp. JC047]